MVNACALTFGGLLLLGGRAGDLLGRRRMFVAGLPIGVAVALAARATIGETTRRTGGFDLPGAVTGTVGVAALVYGLSNAATTSDGVSHWGDARVMAALAAGAAASAGGMYWLSRITEHSSYAGGLFGPSLIAGAGLGLLFVPLPIVALSRVAEYDSGVASSLLNTGRQVGGALGLAVLGTVAWTVTANRVPSGTAGLARAEAYQRALAAGLDRAFLVAAGIAILILVTAMITIRSGKPHGAAPG